VADGGERLGSTARWPVAPGEGMRGRAAAPTPPSPVRGVRLRHGGPSPAGPGLRSEPVSSSVDGEYPCSPQRTQSGAFAVLDEAPAGDAVLSVWAWTPLPVRGRRQVLLARGELELFLDAEGLPSIRFGGVCLSARQPLGLVVTTPGSIELPEDVVGFVQPDRLCLGRGGEAETVPARLVPVVPAVVGVLDLCPQRGWSAFPDLS